MNAVASNVIAFAPAGGRASDMDTRPDTSLLRDIRRRAVDTLGRDAAQAFDKVADELYALAEQSLDRDTRDYYLARKEAWPALRPRLEALFRERLEESFQRRADGQQERTRDFSDMHSAWTELSLVADGELEETVRFTEMAARIRTAADEELSALDQRMAVVLSRPGMESHDNPLSPMAICDAFRSSLSVVESGMRMKLLLIRLFDQGVRDAVVALYQEVNALLRDKGVLPTIRYGTAKKPVSGAGPVTGPRAEGGPAVVGSVMLPLVAAPAGAAGGVTFEAAAPADGGNPFEMLQQLALAMAARQAASAAGIGTGANGQRGAAAAVAATPGTGTATGTGLTGGGFLAHLSRIQQGDFVGMGADVPAALAPSGRSSAHPAGHPGEDALDSAGRIPSHGASPAGTATAPANVLHRLKGTSIASQMEQLDTVTLDIVALLFDQIFSDTRIPAPMKALIGSLQIPMLKVAVLDKAFFSRKSHPARRMLDTLGELSLGLGDGFDASSTLYKRIEAILRRVADEFDDDLGLFDRITAELEALVGDADRTAAQAARARARPIQDRERLEVARLFAQNELRGRVANHPVPRAVLRFLATEWMKLLVLAYAKGGRESRAWQSLVETMDILVWTLTPKHTVEERRRLVSLLPALLKRLHRGMEVIGTTAAVKERFNAVLMRCHARAIAGSNMGTGDVEAPLAAERRAAAAAGARQAAQPEAAKATPPAREPAPAAARLPESPGRAQAGRIPTLVPEPGLPAPAAPAAPLAVPEPLAPSATSMVVEEIPMPAPAGSSGLKAAPDTSGALAAPDASTPATDPLSEAAVLQAELAAVPVPETLPAITVKNPFGDGEIEVEEVSFSDLPGIVASTSAPPPDGDRYTEMAANLREGDWIEIRADDDSPPRQARLSYVSPYRSTYVFANRKGQEIGEFSLYQLTRDLRCGRIALIGSVPLFDRALGGLVGMLRKGADQGA